ncbi:MAG: hypothetical protein AAFU54_29380, partial [Chloroflexota bacterium]
VDLLTDWHHFTSVRSLTLHLIGGTPSTCQMQNQIILLPLPAVNQTPHFTRYIRLVYVLIRACMNILRVRAADTGWKQDIEPCMGTQAVEYFYM